MANPVQRVPLRTLSEHTWNGAKNYQSGNTGAAPSLGRPSIGSPISAAIASTAIAQDEFTVSVNLGGTAVGGAAIPASTASFPNIPILQNTMDSPTPFLSATNQSFPFTAPVGTLIRYLVWAVLDCPPSDANTGNIASVVANVWAQGYAVDTSGKIYNDFYSDSTIGSTSKITTGKSKYPAGVPFKSFNFKTGLNYYVYTAQPTIDLVFSWSVYGALFIDYPSANPS